MNDEFQIALDTHKQQMIDIIFASALLGFLLLGGLNRVCIACKNWSHEIILAQYFFHPSKPKDNITCQMH